MIDPNPTPDTGPAGSAAASPGAQPGSEQTPVVELPAGLGQMPAGSQLCDVLESVDVSQVSGFDTVEVMAAWYRQWCRTQARFLQALLETGLRAPYSTNTVEQISHPDEFSCEEARAALSWSRSRAQRHLVFAVDVFCRLPALGEAMLIGELDESRARAFLDWTIGLTDDQAHQVCAQLLPTAARLTVGELIDQIKRLCLALDPDWAAHRYREALRRRSVHGSRNPDGTANLAGYHQPVERVAAAASRIDALARACKRAGDARPIDHIRSDLYLGMTDGAFTGMTEQQIIDHALANPYTPPPAPHQTELHPTDDDGRGDPDDAEASSGPDDTGGGPDDTGGGPDDTGGGPDDTGGGPGGAGSGDADTGGGPGGVKGAADVRSSVAGAPPRAGRPWAVPELRIRLSTLLGQDDYPAEIPGWDYVPAWLARHLVADMHAAQWRYVLCDNHGQAADSGPLHTRPRRSPQNRTALTNTANSHVARDPRRDGIVEIAFTATELATITDVIADITHRSQPGGAASPNTDAASARIDAAGAGADIAGAWAPVITELLAPRSDRAGSANDNPARRTAGARLRRWIQTRDRTCRHPACRAPAATTDQDHRHGYARGGPTTEHNLDSECRHDHRLTDEAGWTVEPNGPHSVTWISPLGRRYNSTTPPVIVDLPEPAPDPGRHRLIGLKLSTPAPLTPCHDSCGCHTTPGHDPNSCHCGCGEPILPGVADSGPGSGTNAWQSPPRQAATANSDPPSSPP